MFNRHIPPSLDKVRILSSTAFLLAALPALALDQKPMEKPPTPDQLAFFEKKIRPVLV